MKSRSFYEHNYALLSLTSMAQVCSLLYPYLIDLNAVRSCIFIYQLGFEHFVFAGKSCA